MNKIIFPVFFFISLSLRAQTPGIVKSLQLLQQDVQCKHAIIGMYAIDASNGQVLVNWNAEYGLAPASCQKVITAVSSFEMLGGDFHFTTTFGFANNSLYIIGGGDPTFGSSRWPSTKPKIIADKIQFIYKKINQENRVENIYINDLVYGYQPVPDGWVWQDLGNYYGAGSWSLNWKENMYEVFLRSPASTNLPVEIISTDPASFKNNITSMITSAAKNSGDNAWLFSAPYSNQIFATGTIPVNENNFSIKGAMPQPVIIFADEALRPIHERPIIYFSDLLKNKKNFPAKPVIIDSILSPSFDSINFWFLKKSINLFGESFMKEIGNRSGDASVSGGITAIKKFWKNKIDASAMNIIDGSGLSPANRISAKLLVDILQYSRTRNWFPSFYSALPEMNGIKMKDGYITGVRSYTGVIKQKNGKEVIFAFIMNNFDGNPSSVREKMWKILDLLK